MAKKKTVRRARKAKYKTFYPDKPIHPSILIPLLSVLLIFILIILFAINLIQSLY